MSTTLPPTEPAAPVVPTCDPAVRTPPPVAAPPPYRRRRFTAAEYWRMFERGMFGDERVQLLGGEIVLMSPQSDLHGVGISVAYDAIAAAFGPGFWVRNQLTLALTPTSVVDPDIAVVPGDKRTYWGKKAPPKAALLVVEVSHTTLRLDRTRKASLYAAAGIADYWIVNLTANTLEVRRDPRPDATKTFGHGYSSLVTLSAGEFAAPLAAPAARVAVADLLPA